MHKELETNENLRENVPPVILHIYSTYSTTSKYKLVEKRYTSSSMIHFTRHIHGRYKSDKGVIDKALEIADKYYYGEYVVCGTDPRPVQIKLPRREDIDKNQLNKVDEKYLGDFSAV